MKKKILLLLKYFYGNNIYNDLNWPFNHCKSKFTIIIFIHYQSRNAVAILAL